MHTMLLVLPEGSNEENGSMNYFRNLILNYSKPRFELGMAVENLLDIAWNEAQFDTESRLYDEASPVSEIHFTPGVPRFFKFQVRFFW